MNPSTPKNSPASLHRRKAKIARMTRARRSKYGTPMTPLLRWKLEDEHGSVHSGGRERLQFQARKLAAGLWQFHYKEISRGGGGGKALGRETHDRRGSQGGVSHHHRQSRNGRAEAEHGLPSPCSFARSNNGIQRKAAATKWDAEATETADTLGRFYSRKKLLGEQPFAAASVVSNLKAELLLAQTRIRKLESRQRYSKKKVERLKGTLEEDRASWSRYRHLKLVDELDQERKTRQQFEILNANLVKELADAKVYARKYKQEYEKEKKSREIMEEVCAELAKQIVEDKAKVDALRGESMKLCEELEQERKMLQMAEVWREERIQMKLIDAKLALEDKYCQMNKLITDLENFLMSRSEKLDVMELRRAELIQQAAKSVNIEDIEDLFYEPKTHNLMLSLLEDLKEASNFEEIEKCINGYTQDNHGSRLHSSSPRSPKFNQSHLRTDDDHETNLDQSVGGSKAEKCVEEPELGNNSFREHELDRISKNECVSESKTKYIQSSCHDSPNRAPELCSISSKQTTQKIIDESSGRYSNRTVSSEGELKDRDSVSRRSSQHETVNPHIKRGTHGCIEWPRGIQRNCFKTKPLDARIESQKSQLRHVLKHRVK